jgi:TRAP-type C4-dicarboxylate transport system permease small subunit
MSILIKLDEFINKVFEGFSIVLLVGILIASTLQVITRYIFNSSLTGTEELARYCSIWMSMLGASICVRYGTHASVSLINDSLTGKVKCVHSILINLLIIILAIILINQGFKMVNLTWTQCSPSLRIPMSYVYLAIPVGSIGMVLNAVRNIVESFIKWEGR